MIRSSAGYYFSLKPKEWAVALPASLFLAAIIGLFFSQVMDIWIFWGLGFSIFVLIHLFLAADRCVVLPELICFIACVNLIVAPWLSYIFPPSFYLFIMWVPADQFFSYSVPAIAALWIGIHSPLRLRSPGYSLATKRPPLTGHDRLWMDGLIVCGILFSVLSLFASAGLGFLFHLLSQLRFVGALSFLLTNTPGWRMRIAPVYFMLLLSALASALFYELVLWSGYLFICLAYTRRWKWRIMVYLLITLVGLTFLNDIKLYYRQQVQTENLSRLEQVKVFVGLLLNYKEVEKGPGQQTTITLGDRLVRWNHGWIVSKVLFMVPEVEPYARGETLIAAAIASIIPRALKPEKTGAVSKEIFERFTGIRLPEGTSMALGVAGEMYANFGRWGGVACMFFYGYLIGFIFSKFANLALRNTLWWAWVPFVLLASLEAEWNFVDILNYIAKSLIVMVAIVYFVPPLNSALFKKKRSYEASQTKNIGYNR